ncbi:MAG TPA: hypothetical protein VMS01_01250 [Stellaceae bacterium]|nr:hypothetical protein [Stellaceae bacterium]
MIAHSRRFPPPGQVVRQGAARRTRHWFSRGAAGRGAWELHRPLPPATI